MVNSNDIIRYLMMKILLTGMLLLSSNALAYSSSFSGVCDFDVKGGVRISSSEIEFLNKNEPLYKIVNDNILIVNNKEITLNTSQQKLVSSYSYEIRGLLPQIKTLTTDAITLASEGVNLAFTELLGPNNSLSNDLTSRFEEIHYEIDQNFSANKTVHFDEDGFVGDDFFGENFEKIIESVVEQTVQKSIGSIMIALGQELLFSNEGGASFEAKMEKFGEKIETEMEARGMEIEKRAVSVCSAIFKIDKLEEKLQSEIEQLEDIDMLSI